MKTTAIALIEKASFCGIQFRSIVVYICVIWFEDHSIRYNADEIASTPRVGVAYTQEDTLLPWRFFIKGNNFPKLNKCIRLFLVFFYCILIF